MDEPGGADLDVARASVRALAERLASLPEHLAASLAWDVPTLSGRPVVATGIGQSTGPAELLVEALRASGRPAELRPMSRFLASGPDEQEAILVVFSQRISPNASLALARAPRFGEAWVVTSCGAGTWPGTSWLRLPGPAETGTLVRVVGPVLASAAALRLGGAEPPPGLFDAVRRALEPRTLPYGASPVVFVAPPTPGSLAAARALAWTWLEATGRWALAVDALELAHGPLQSVFDARASVVVLEGQGDPPGLTERVAAVLAPARHELVRLRSELPAPWASVEHLVLGLRLVVTELERAPRDLSRWPGQGADGPLYGLGAGRSSNNG